MKVVVQFKGHYVFLGEKTQLLSVYKRAEQGKELQIVKFTKRLLLQAGKCNILRTVNKVRT